MYIYNYITDALDESVFLDLHDFSIKYITPHDLEATPMGGATSKPVIVVVFTLVDVS